MLKVFLKIFKRFLVFLLITITGGAILLFLICNMFCNGPSELAKKQFVSTILETGQLKDVVKLFLSDKEILNIVNGNKLAKMELEIDPNMISVKTPKLNNKIVIENVYGNTFDGKMMIISNPKNVFLATTYPWQEYGKKLDELIKDYGAIGGVNGGLYFSEGNKGGMPRGIVVSKGEVQYVTPKSRNYYLVGFDKNNILRIIDLEQKNEEEIRKVIKDENIRDAIAFQEEYSDSNNHFVKLIINGEKRELNGLGSGANPRTAIGQRKDGSVLLLVTDGRGKNGHLGATAADLIEIMAKYDAINAANIDGGSSSSMYYNNEYLVGSVTFYQENTSWHLPTAFAISGD